MVSEELRLARFEVDGLPMVDVRYWRETRLGPRPTKKGIAIEQKIVTRLIAALIKMHESYSHDGARRPANVKG